MDDWTSIIGGMDFAHERSCGRGIVVRGAGFTLVDPRTAEQGHNYVNLFYDSQGLLYLVKPLSMF